MASVSVLLNGIANTRVCRNTTCNGDGFNACVLNRFREFIHQSINDGLLKRSSQVVLVFLNKVRVQLHFITEGVEERGFQTTETVVIARNVWL